MAGILDKIKGMFGGKQAEADTTASAATAAGDVKVDDAKQDAGETTDEVADGQ